MTELKPCPFITGIVLEAGCVAPESEGGYTRINVRVPDWRQLRDYPRNLYQLDVVVAAVADYTALTARVSELEAENARLREALEQIISDAPRAYTPDCEYWDSGNFDDAYQYGVDTGCFQNAETARAALSPKPEGGQS